MFRPNARLLPQEVSDWKRHLTKAKRVAGKIPFRYVERAIFPGMRDPEVRQLLRAALEKRYGTDPTTLIIDELGLCRGSVRADLVVINGTLKGYEIKSERDTLARLSGQAKIYNKVFDTMTIVVADKHLRHAEAIAPEWWGIDVILGDSSPFVASHRGEASNPSIDPGSLVELLWRDEVIATLRRLGETRCLESQPRKALWATLSAAVPLMELRSIVRNALKSRDGWRDPGPQTTDGVMCPPFARSSGYPSPPARPRSRRHTYRPN
jgi:hypothetical protein